MIRWTWMWKRPDDTLMSSQGQSMAGWARELLYFARWPLYTLPYHYPSIFSLYSSKCLPTLSTWIQSENSDFFSPEKRTFFSFCYQLLTNSTWWVLLPFFGLGQLNLSFNFLLLDHNVYVPKNEAGESFLLNPFFSIRTLAIRRLEYV